MSAGRIHESYALRPFTSEYPVPLAIYTPSKRRSSLPLYERNATFTNYIISQKIQLVNCFFDIFLLHDALFILFPHFTDLLPNRIQFRISRYFSFAFFPIIIRYSYFTTFFYFHTKFIKRRTHPENQTTFGVQYIRHLLFIAYMGRANQSKTALILRIPDPQLCSFWILNVPSFPVDST